MIQRVAGADDPLLHDYVALTDVALRRVREPVDGLFIAEGETVIRRALRADYTPRSFLLAERWLVGLDDIIASRPELPILVADEDVLQSVTGYSVHRGALASFHRPIEHALSEVVATARRVVVLEDIVDHTNVGAVFRSSAALGVDAIVISPRCADPLYRRSVKVSMGAVFTVPWTRADHWPDAIDLLRERGFATLALTPQGETSLRDVAHSERWALLLGTEGTGLSAEALARCDTGVRIPMSSGIDSLNVAAAAAVACYELQG